MSDPWTETCDKFWEEITEAGADDRLHARAYHKTVATCDKAHAVIDDLRARVAELETELRLMRLYENEQATIARNEAAMDRKLAVAELERNLCRVHAFCSMRYVGIDSVQRPSRGS